MDTPNSKLIAKSIFLEAMELPAGKRPHFVKARCNQQQSLETEVCELLQHYETACDDSVLNLQFDKVLVRELLSANQETDEPAAVFRLDRIIGGGGCAVVYTAQQTAPIKRRVAVKMLREEFLQNEELLNRFRFEQKAQAALNHPNVVRIHDAGESDARQPFLVMELLNGNSITTHCEQQNLSILTRLDLFLDVCKGVEHAHQRGIVHRDLKPANMLVTEENGVTIAKVIDFGIATATEDFEITKTEITQSGQFVGTCAYMSPEQFLSSKDVDTRSDIFSMGVSLFELLSGRHPFHAGSSRSSSFNLLRDRICHSEPSEFTTLSPSQHAVDERTGESEKPKCTANDELKWIVLKCLEKDPERRYASVGALADDIHRYINHEPVFARPPSKLYAFSKFYRRNRGMVLAALALVACLVCGLLGTTVGMQSAMRRAAKANLEKEEALKKVSLSDRAVNLINGMFDGERYLSDQNLKAIRGRRFWLDEAIEMAMSSSKKPALKEANLRKRTGVFLAKLNSMEGAEAQFRKAIDVYSGVLPPDNRVLLNTKLNLATVLWLEGNNSAALTLASEVYDVRKDKLPPDNVDLLSTMDCVARCLPMSEAESFYEDTIQHCHRSFRGGHYFRILVIRHNYGVLMMEKRDFGKAATAFADVLEREIAQRGRLDPRTTFYRVTLVKCLRLDQQFDRAIEEQKKLCQLKLESNCESYPDRLLVLAELQLQKGQAELAISNAQRALDVDTRQPKKSGSAEQVVRNGVNNFLRLNGLVAGGNENER